MANSGTVQTSTRPSFFEIYAAQHLNTALRPAIRFALDVLSLRQSRLRPLANWSDEVFTGFLIVVEIAQLRRHSALLCESFYALRRSASLTFTPNDTDVRLPRTRIALSVLLDIIFPYLRAKFDALHSSATGGAAADLFDDDHESESTNVIIINERLTSTVDTTSSRNPCNGPGPTRRNARTTWMEILRNIIQSPKRALEFARALRFYIRSDAFRRLAIRWYPIIKSVIETCNVLLSLLYVYGHSRYFSLSLLLQRLVLRRDTQIDFLRLALADKMRMNVGSFSLTAFADRLLSWLKTGFLASIFAFRFLQYYYAAEASVPTEVGPALPPPERLHPAEGVDERTALAPGMCPICRQYRVNSTACTSGFLFCYLCIVSHVQVAGNCPVTLAPTGVDDLVRVYEDEGLS